MTMALKTSKSHLLTHKTMCRVAMLAAEVCFHWQLHFSSCWITPDRGTNWAFHGPVIAVLYTGAYVISLSTKHSTPYSPIACIIHVSLPDQPVDSGLRRKCHCEADSEER